MRLCAGLLLSNKSQVQGQRASQLIMLLCLLLPECLAQSQHIGLSEYLTDGLGSHKGSPESLAGSSLGTPPPSWEWSSACRTAPETKGVFPPWAFTTAKAQPLLPGLCLGCEKYHSCSCSGCDLGEKEKKVHQRKLGSCRSFPLVPPHASPSFITQTRPPLPSSPLPTPGIASAPFLPVLPFYCRFSFPFSPSVCCALLSTPPPHLLGQRPRCMLWP